MAEEQEAAQSTDNEWTPGKQILAASMLTSAALLLTESNLPLALVAPPDSIGRWLRPLFLIAAWTWTGWQWREAIRLYRNKKREQAKRKTERGVV